MRTKTILKKLNTRNEKTKHKHNVCNHIQILKHGTTCIYTNKCIHRQLFVVQHHVQHLLNHSFELTVCLEPGGLAWILGCEWADTRPIRGTNIETKHVHDFLTYMYTYPVVTCVNNCKEKYPTSTHNQVGHWKAQNQKKGTSTRAPYRIA